MIDTMRLTQFEAQTALDVPVDALQTLLQSNQQAFWLDITGPDATAVHLMTDSFQFHPLAIEDTMNQNQLPKAEEYSDHLFIILDPVNYPSDIPFRELNIFIGQRYIVTVHPAEEPVLEKMRQRILRGPITSPAPSYLLYTLMDVIVDEYIPILEAIETEIEELEDQILSRPLPAQLNRLFQLRRSLNEFWRVARPQRTIINFLMNHEYVFITKQNQYHLRDVSDHLLQVTDLLASNREMSANLVHLYLSATSHRLNQVVSRLTVFTIIIGFMTVISGFYGMNFVSTWPPFDQSWGIIFALGTMVTTIVLTISFFRWRGWI